jgi:hypothetical protein
VNLILIVMSPLLKCKLCKSRKYCCLFLFRFCSVPRTAPTWKCTVNIWWMGEWESDCLNSLMLIRDSGAKLVNYLLIESMILL